MRTALGAAQGFDIAPTEREWGLLMSMASRQGVMGVAFDGVERLPHDQRPPLYLLMDWSGAADYIEHENRRLNELCVQMCSSFGQTHVKACILKGQGMSVLYPKPLRRSNGDIDVWMAGGKDRVVDYVLQRFPEAKVEGGSRGHHVALAWKGTAVEVHYWPARLYRPRHTRQLFRWYRELEKEPWDNEVALPEGVGEIVVPRREFNLVFTIVHMFYHWAFEGCGMKQLIDLFWLVKTLDATDDAEKKRVVKRLRSLGLGGFLSAMMYVLQVLGLESAHMLCKPNERLGQLLLEDILQVGTVTAADLADGQYGQEGKVHKFFRRFRRMCRMLPMAPSELPWMLAHNVISWMSGGTRKG